MTACFGIINIDITEKSDTNLEHLAFQSFSGLASYIFSGGRTEWREKYVRALWTAFCARLRRFKSDWTFKQIEHVTSHTSHIHITHYTYSGNTGNCKVLQS